MIIHGDPIAPDQTGMDFPRILYALVVPESDENEAILHAVGCAAMVRPAGSDGVRVAETVYSTTFREILDYAMRQFGDQGDAGWATCHVCGGVPDNEMAR